MIIMGFGLLILGAIFDMDHEIFYLKTVKYTPSSKGNSITVSWPDMRSRPSLKGGLHENAL